MTGDEKAARFRQTPPPQGHEDAPPYRAFGVVEGNPASGSVRLPARLELRTSEGICSAGFYAHIKTIEYAGDGSAVILRQDPSVVIKGRCLLPLAHALVAGTCEYVAAIRDGQSAADGDAVVDFIGWTEGS